MHKINLSGTRRHANRDRKLIKTTLKKVVKSGNFVLGEEVANFENELATFIGTKFAVGVGTGTDALIIALRAIGIRPSDEVIVPSHTATATVAAVASIGAVPVFADIDPRSFTLEADSVEKAINSKTKAVIAVHLYGQMADLHSLSRICKDKGIALIEDCAQAIGATQHGIRSGSVGLVSIFSFYPTKNLSALGDGGALVTNSAEIYERAKSLRQYGWDESRESIEISAVTRLDEIQAAILSARLVNLDNDNDKRNEIASHYAQVLAECNFLLPHVVPGNFHVYHLYVVQVENRDHVMETLSKHGIETGIHYKKPVHKNQAFFKFANQESADLKNTEEISGKILSLPMFPELTRREVKLIGRVLSNV